MTEENHNLFLLVAGKELNKAQLQYFKRQLSNQELDIAELFKTAVVCRQFDAAKLIIDFGFDMNKEFEIMAYELFICSQKKGLTFCIAFYLNQGLKITDTLLNELLKYAKENSTDFDFRKAIEFVEELKQKRLN